MSKTTVSWATDMTMLSRGPRAVWCSCSSAGRVVPVGPSALADGPVVPGADGKGTVGDVGVNLGQARRGVHREPDDGPVVEHDPGPVDRRDEAPGEVGVLGVEALPQVGLDEPLQ